MLALYLYVRHADALRVFFFNDTATTEIYTLSLHDALPICRIRATSASLRLANGSGRKLLASTSVPIGTVALWPRSPATPSSCSPDSTGSVFAAAGGLRSGK